MKDQRTLTLIILLTLPLSSTWAQEIRDQSNNPTAQTGIIDQTYLYLNNTFSLPAIWFDQFFAEPLTNEESRSKTMVSWDNDLGYYEVEKRNFQTRVNARVYLPHITHKLKLIFEPEDQQTDEETSVIEQQQADNELGIRYDVTTKKYSSFNIKATLRPSIEARYRYKHPVTEYTSFRFIQKIYQKEKVTGESSRLDFNYSLTPTTILRLSNWAKWESDISAFTTGSKLTLYQYLSEKKAINYSIGMSQMHKPRSFIDNTNVALTYRQNIFKEWLFYEIRPKINWDKDYHQQRIRDASITLRLEVLFTGV